MRTPQTRSSTWEAARRSREFLGGLPLHRWEYYLSDCLPADRIMRSFVEQIEARIADGTVGIKQPTDEPRIESQMEDWLKGLTNRNAADDRSRVKKHVLPVFGARRLSEVGLPAVMAWLDEMQAAGEISGGSMRHNLNALSRFFSWAIERGYVEVNPVKQIPQGRRPKAAAKTIQPYIEDDKVVLIKGLPEPIDKMFYLDGWSP